MSYARFDAVAFAIMVVGEGRIIYVNDALLRLVGMRRDDLVGAEHTSVHAPEERERLADRYRRHLRGEPVPVEYESTLLSKAGARYAVRVGVTVEGKDVIVQFQDVSEAVARRDRLLSVARLGVAIQSVRDDETIFRIVRDELGAVGLTMVLLRRSGDRGIIESIGAPPALLAALEEALGSVLVGRSGRWLPIHDVAWRDGGMFSDDALLAIAEFVSGDSGEAVRELASRANLSRAAIVRLDIGGQPSFLMVVLGAWLREEDLPALTLFGAQVSAALSAARIISDLSRRNAELATLNRLAAISRSAIDLAVLFKDGVVEIVRSFEAGSAAVYLVDHERDELVLEHGYGPAGEAIAAVLARVPLASSASIASKVARSGKPGVFGPGDYSEPARSLLERAGVRVIAAVPLVSRSAVVGVMNLAYHEPREVAGEELALLEAMGSHFGAAVEAHRLLADLRLRIDELTLVHEVGRALVESLELDQVLDTATRNLARTVDAPDAYLLLADDDDHSLVVHSSYGSRADSVGRRIAADRADNLAAWAFSTQENVIIEDADTDPRVNRGLRAETRGTAYVALPLVVRGRAIGVAVVIETRGPRRFPQAEIERVAAIANQIAVAVENARLYDDLRRSYSALGRAQRQLVERERLAAIGELAAVVAHEVRNPLNVIFNSLGSLKRLVKLEGNAKMLLDIVGEEADRLNRIVSDLLDYARPVVLNVKPESLARILDEAIASALSAGGGIEIERDIEVTLPEVVMDARLMRQAVINIALNAVQAMSHGGTLRLAAHHENGSSGEFVIVELGDTGAGIAEENKRRIFEPFFTTKSTGTGLGLAVVKRIVESHRGEISVESQVGVGTTFTIRLPLEHAVAGGARSPS